MTSSHKLSTAVKALCYLAEKFPVPLTSGEIAEHIGVNASKLRQILSLLCKNEIVASVKGTQGGFVLMQDFTELSLYEIYNAIDDRSLLNLGVAQADGKNLKENEKYNSYFNHYFYKIQRKIEEGLKEVKLNNIKEDIKSGNFEINDIGEINEK